MAQYPTKRLRRLRYNPKVTGAIRVAAEEKREVAGSQGPDTRKEPFEQHGRVVEGWISICKTDSA